MKKILAIFITLIICTVIICIVSFSQNIQDNSFNNANKQNEMIRDLYKEKELIIKEIESIKENINVSNCGSVVLLLTDINRNHLNDSIRIIDGQGYHGVIALSKDDLSFNNKDLLNKNELMDLKNKGYEFVIKINFSEDPKSLYDYFNNEGIEVQGFYVVGNAGQAIVESVKKTDKKIVICDSFSSEDDEIFFINKYGNMYPSIKTKFNDSVKHSDTIAISVGYSNMIYEEFNEENYNSMFKTINPYVNDNLTSVCNITEASNRKDDLNDYLSVHYIEQEQEIERLEKRIEDINKEIISIGD